MDIGLPSSQDVLTAPLVNVNNRGTQTGDTVLTTPNLDEADYTVTQKNLVTPEKLKINNRANEMRQRPEVNMQSYEVDMSVCFNPDQ